MCSKKGFTLVELLVVVAVIIILSSLLISYFSQIGLRFALSRVVHEFANDVRTVQQMALSSSDYLDSSGIVLSSAGFGVYVDASEDAGYILYADRMPGNQRYDEDDYHVKLVDLRKGLSRITIQSLNHSVEQRASIHFQSQSPHVIIDNLARENVSLEIVFAIDSRPEIQRTVVVHISGLIEVK